MSSKRRGGCKHKRVWRCGGRYGNDLILSAPDYPGVSIEAWRIEFCEQCGKFRLLGLDKNHTASPWKAPRGIGLAIHRASHSTVVTTPAKAGV